MAKEKPLTAAAPAAPAPNPPRPIGTIIDDLRKIRDKRKELAAGYEEKDKPLKEQAEELEKALISRFKTEKSEGGRSKTFSATLKSAMTYSVADRAALEAYATKNKCLQVFTNHLSSASIAELIASINQKVKDPKKHITELPGTKSFEKQSITLTALKGA